MLKDQRYFSETLPIGAVRRAILLFNASTLSSIFRHRNEASIDGTPLLFSTLSKRSSSMVGIHPPAAGSVTNDSRNAYTAVASIVFVVAVGRLIGRAVRDWYGGDFWHHSAVVRELAADPLHPAHPILALDAPHSFFTPWALTAGLFSRVSGIDPVHTLSLFAIAHLLLLLIALPLFVKCFSPEKGAPVFVLLFTLFLWGWQPWEYSSFLHFGQLSASITYPSAFAFSLALLGPWLTLEYARTGHIRFLILLGVVSILVLLTHPPTAAFLFTSLCAVLIGHPQLSYSRYRIGVVVVVLAAFGVATVWPYYPFWELILSDAAAYDGGNETMYRRVIGRIFPALIVGIPLLVLRYQRNHRDSLVMLTLALAGLYLFGGLTGRWSLGRVLPFVILTFHVAGGDWAAQVYRQIREQGWTTAQRWGAKFAAPALLLLLLRPFALTAREVTPFRVWPQWARPPMVDFQAVAVVAEHIAPNDVVAADQDLSWYLPTLGAKVVAPLHMQAFVHDVPLRRYLTDRFFFAEASCDERIEYIRRFDPDLILVDKQGNAHAHLRPILSRIGTIVHEDDRFFLTRVDSPAQMALFDCASTR